MAEAIAAHGMLISDLRGYQAHILPSAVSFSTDIRAASQADLVLITVKSGSTDGVAAELAAALTQPKLIVSFQNGLHNAQRLRERLPAHRVLAGMVPFNVLQRPPAAFHQGSSGELMVQGDPGLAPFLTAFQLAGLELQQRTDMPAVQNAKLLLNLNNALNALSDLPLRDELSQRAWRCCLAMAQQEALRIFKMAGLPVARLTPIPPRWLPLLLRLPDRLFQHAASRMLAVDPLARSSMWEDLQAGRPTEVDAIQGEIMALAEAHAVRAPVNATLCALVKEAERRRAPHRGAEVLATLKAAARAAH
jgi:2-dehydropantoate 2-reductase